MSERTNAVRLSDVWERAARRTRLIPGASRSPSAFIRVRPRFSSSSVRPFVRVPFRWVLLAVAIRAAVCAPVSMAQKEPKFQLVEIQKTDQDRFNEIALLIGTQKLAEAVESLNAIATSTSVPGYYPDPDDPRRHGNTIEAACRILGTLPAAARQAYVQRHDAVAAEQLDRARTGDNAAAIESVAARYFHTLAGAQAVRFMASSAFDRGRHLDAAALWESLYLKHSRLDADRATLLAKACTAYHLAGARNQARKLLERAEAGHAADEVSIAGKKQPLTAYLKQLLGREPAVASAPLASSAVWSSLGGNNRALAVLPDCDATPFPLPVVAPGAQGRSASGLSPQLVESVTGSDPNLTVAMEAGRIRVGGPISDDARRAVEIAPLSHPVVVNNLLIRRDHGALVAVAADSAREAWRATGMPLYEPRRGNTIHIAPYLALAGDMGRNILTVADGRVYCLGRFSPPGSDAGDGSSAARQPSGSTLYALTLGDKGAEESWAVGNGRGGADWLRTAKFLTAPALDRGRLYVLTRQGNRYTAVCLDAVKGEPIWMTTIGLVPMRDGSELSQVQALALELVTERGTPPAIADGTVFFLTNAGIVTALDADTGAPLWAHRYDSIAGGSVSKPSIVTAQGYALRLVTMRRPLPPVNPIVVMEDRVVCLPCDSGDAMAFHARSGKLLWRLDRAGQGDLTAVDRSRLLLSGPDLALVGASDGAILHRTASGILGRPAVTATEAFASGDGAIVRLNLAALSLVEMPVRETNGVLGSLVVAGGKLFAANAAALGAYMTYDDAVQAIRADMARIGDAAARVARDLDLRQLSLSCGRLDDAATGLAALLPDAQKTGNPEHARRARALLHRTRMAQSRAASNPDDQQRFLDQALQLAASAAERIAVLDERARALERAGRVPDAVRALQTAVERLVAGISSSNPAAVDLAAVREAWFARDELNRLARRHGEAICEPLDTALSAELDAAGQDQARALLACAKWPCAKRTPDALLAAADAAMRASASASAPDLAQAMRAARLAAAAGTVPRGDACARSLAARTLIDLGPRPRAARVAAQRLATLKTDASVAFGGFSGTVADLASLAATNGGPSLPPSDAEFGFVSVPLGLLYERGGAPIEALRDCRGRVLRCGDLLFLSGEEDLACLDTQSRDPESAQLWRVEVPRPVDRLPRIGQVSADGKRLAVYDRNAIRLLDIASGRLLGVHSFDWLGARGWIAAAGEDDWLAIAGANGTIAGLRLSDGARLWEVGVRDAFFDRLAASAGILLASDKRRTTDLLFDLRSGRVLDDGPMSEKGSETALSPDGWALVLDTNGTVSVHDAWAPRGEGARTASLGGQDWRLLGLGPGFAAFVARDGSGPVRVLNFSDFDRAIELTPGPAAAPKRRAHTVVFHDNRAFLVFVESSLKGDGVVPSLAAYELPSGKMLWTRELAPGHKGPCRVTMPEAWGSAVSVAIAPTDALSSGRQLVFRVEDGAAFDCRTQTGIAQEVAARTGGPIVANGRVFIAGTGGLSCLAVVE